MTNIFLIGSNSNYKTNASITITIILLSPNFVAISVIAILRGFRVNILYAVKAPLAFNEIQS